MSSAYLYIRVSTDEQADKGYSQRNQDEMLQRYCTNKMIGIAKVFYEDHSAKTFNRPAWKEMLRTVKKASPKNRPGLILFTKWDRFSRNTSDAYQMISILNSYNIEPQAIEQPLDLAIPENKMMLAFYLAAPEVENDRRGLNIFYGIRRAKKEGRWIGHAPVGYENKTTEGGRKYISPNIPQANLMRIAFAELATGRYAIQQVWKKARTNGLESQSSNFQTAIRNPVYCGKILVPAFKDESLQIVQGQHEAIISEQLFHKVQLVLRGKNKVKGTSMSALSYYPLRGFLKCPNCERMLTASTSKGRNGYFHYYHCSNVCKTRFKAAVVNDELTTHLRKFTPLKPFEMLFREILKDVIKQDTWQHEKQREQTIAMLNHQQARLIKIREMLIDDKIGAEDFQHAKVQTEEKINALQIQLNILPNLKESILKMLNSGSRTFLDLAQVFQSAETKDQRKLLAKLFTGPLLYENGGFAVELNQAPIIVYRLQSSPIQ